VNRLYFAKRTPVSRHIYTLAAELARHPDIGTPSPADTTVPVTQALRTLWDNLRSGNLSQVRITG